MKNLRMRILVLGMCISLLVPHVMVNAAPVGESTGFGTEIDPNTGLDEEPNGETSDLEKESGEDKADENSDLEEESAEKESGGKESDEKSDLDGQEVPDEESDQGTDENAGLVDEISESVMYDASPDDEPESGIHGSGSYQLNKVPDDYRFYTEYYVAAASDRSFTTANVDRRTTIKVYARKDEYILFGSSVANSEIDENNNWTKNVTGADIVITTPDNKKVGYDVLLPEENNDSLGVGYIANPTQEKYGPMVNHTDEKDTSGKYYAPLKYRAPASGVYTFEFHSVRGYNDGSVPTPKLAKDGKWQQGTTTVAAWDVTVLGENSGKWEVKEGRAWADYLALSTGGAGSTTSDLNLHVLTHDGYVYKVDFEKAVPFGFIFFANNTGFMTSVTDDHGNKSYRPVYHSFYDSTNDLDGMENENIVLHKPNDADTDTEETYKIFFNKPSDDLSEIEGVITEPVSNVVLGPVNFMGIGSNIALTKHGGYFNFTSNSEAMVTIQLDLRKAIFESEGTMDSYEGSGMVEITAPAHAGDNSFYWDGKDTEGVFLPAGIYGNSNVVIATEIKRGELHFPVIDMEGLNGGLHVERLNGADSTEGTRYDLYYNNNPLAYGTLEGKNSNRVISGKYDVLTDGTKSYKISSDKGGIHYFPKDDSHITTLEKDTKEYLSKKYFNSSYELLSPGQKSIIDAEFGKEQDTFHFTPVDSRSTTMTFYSTGYNGGGNQAGIDAWTYYSQEVDPRLISFAIMASADRGLVRGQIFYDADKNSEYNAGGGDYFLSNVKVRLIDGNGKALVHEEELPCFDEAGYFIYNDDGTVKHEKQSISYEAVTDSSGVYRFTGVPYSSTGEKYYVQVLLTDVQSEVLRYTCTTSQKVKDELKTADNTPFLSGTIAGDCGSDGNLIVATDDPSKIYRHKYDRDTETNETKFDKDNAQEIIFSTSSSTVEHGIHVKDFNKIGYCTTVPAEHMKDYKLHKNWGSGTHAISDGLIVELWVWNDNAVHEENALELSRRTGALMDTQVLSEENGWEYKWKNLDDRLQYYILEYYAKKKPNGEVIYNDKHEPRKVLIGGTMPIFSTIPAGNNGTYGFAVSLGDYPETIPDPTDATKRRIKIQSFKGGGTHANSITKKEKLESIDNNARQYDVTYDLPVEQDGLKEINVIELNNSQVYDDRTYYVWLNHQTELPDFVGKTFLEADGTRNSHALVLEPDVKIEGTDKYSIKGISVSSVDAAQSANFEGNATQAFRIAANSKKASFTATNQGNYKTGIGTRTYQVKYVIDKLTNKPVSIVTNEDKELVLRDNNSIKVESSSDYIVYSWFMTIHVYDVEPDGVIEYDPDAGTVNLQSALTAGSELKWELKHDEQNANSVVYVSDDKRNKGILHNDIYRVPLYKAAENPNMGSCADLVGIAYAGSSTVDDISKLVFEDTYQSRYAANDLDDELYEDGKAFAQGSGGYLSAELSVPRNVRINRTQDHANYVDVNFTPGSYLKSRASGSGEDVFYYKLIVFAEDYTYQYYGYDDIDASEGVVMYTYFTMKPKHDGGGGEDPKHTPSSTEIIVLDTNGNVVTGIKPGDGSPKTGDNNNLILWASLAVAGAGLVGFGLYNNKSVFNSKHGHKKRRHIHKR